MGRKPWTCDGLVQSLVKMCNLVCHYPLPVRERIGLVIVVIMIAYTLIIEMLRNG